MSELDTIGKIRELHKPVPQTRSDGRIMWHNCEGCDQGPHPEDNPEWPCRTAELVYSPDEIRARHPDRL